MSNVKPLEVSQLCRSCDATQFKFETTAELEPLKAVIGQDRALEALDFGIGMRQEGYNLFALGPNGIGKYTAIRNTLEQCAKREATPPDWCYVYNFETPHQPNAIALPPGLGSQLCADMDRLTSEVFAIISSAFESEEYQNQKKIIAEELQAAQESSLEEIKASAAEKSIALVQTPSGLAFAPLQEEEVISPEEFMKLPGEERKGIETTIAQLQERLQKIIRSAPQLIRKSNAKIRNLDREVASAAMAPLLDELAQKYAAIEKFADHLSAVREDILNNTAVVVDSEESPVPAGLGAEVQGKQALARRYKVNLIVSSSNSAGAPVVYVQNPTFQELVGRVEHTAQLGTLTTDFTLIKSGALHKANGGYLIIDVHRLLAQQFAWEALKRALRSSQIAIESPGQALSMVSTVTLEPEPIPLNVKVVLIGERSIYYLLHEYDPDFSELFKVAADFEEQMERSKANNHSYARLIGTVVRKEDLLHLSKAAVARVIERSSRVAGDAEKLSAHMQSTADLLREASFWAGKEDAAFVDVAHVDQAIAAQIYRASRIRERMQEAVIRETILIDTEGERIGQINGLSVMSLGNFAFGKPSRITARVRMGDGEVLDIERQVELGGPLHSKGVLILSSFLGSRYAEDRPLSLSASLVFEQSYGGIDGDSASSAELYALLSALARVPIRQSLAVTGSVNQYGEVQAIGGVNEKIEGFFDLCFERGLTGQHGVLIPNSNVKNLMLREDIREAVANGQFNVFPITTIEEGIEVLTGVPAGAQDEEGNYPEGTINSLVVARLDDMAARQKAYRRPMPENMDQKPT